MSHYPTLAAELALASYDGLTNQQALDALLAPIPIRINPEVKALRRYLITTGKIGLMKIAAEGTDSAAVVCRTALEALAPGGFETLEYTSPDVYASLTAMLDVVVAANLLSQADKTAILALGDSTTTRAAQIGWPLVTIHDVAHARSL
jgi:hypothetical protein